MRCTRIAPIAIAVALTTMAAGGRTAAGALVAQSPQPTLDAPKAVPLADLGGFTIPARCDRACHLDALVYLEGYGAPRWSATFGADLPDGAGALPIALPDDIRERLGASRQDQGIGIRYSAVDAEGHRSSDHQVSFGITKPPLDRSWIAKCVPLGPRTVSIGEVVHRGGFSVRVRCAGATELWVTSDLDHPTELGIPDGHVQGVDAQHKIRTRGPGIRRVFLRQPAYALRALARARSATATVVVMGRIKGADRYRSTPETVITTRFRRP